ncbi:4-hydroxybenzoate 3-monooxygenase [Nocardia jiangxiensis]|uniref:4-hydroxybenzoate 3-monooxygenase n=1 Tax=Nocardia jiangxiensis TaxID=282685 RepID=A0ABW6SCA6_9NOCA|nr:4-hydroxybenzoate 3-monooxygenase [Nocardia jiangxiensis]
MRTRVVIIGAGPSGLLLSHLLGLAGIESVLLERQAAEHVQARVRAGILESSTVQLLRQVGLGERLDREGIEHRGIYLQWPQERHHLDFVELTGRSVWVYGQAEVTKDLMAARAEAGQVAYYEVSDVELHDVDSDRPAVNFVDSTGRPQRIDAQIVVGCDGYRGPSKQAIPGRERQTYERTYPFAWLGVLAEVEPSTDELIYAWHPDGFALHSMRSRSVSRFYLQVSPAEDISQWSDDRIWDGLATRFALDGWTLKTGAIAEKSVLPMRSFVTTPMRYGRLFLAGDAAHIVPPTGAKGLNLAVADVDLLSRAIIAWLHEGNTGPAATYSETALNRVWRSTHFSWWMTTMLHRHGDDFDAELQLSQLRRIVQSPSAATELAENYAGLPLERVTRRAQSTEYATGVGPAYAGYLDLDKVSARAEFRDDPDLTESSVDDGWEPLLRGWIEEAACAGIVEATAMLVSTVECTDNGPRPTSRTVLCSGLSSGGVVFFTDRGSSKGHQLTDVPYASVTFVWPALGRQVHLRGPVRQVPAEVTAVHWHSRPRGVQLGAWASQQSRPIASRVELDRVSAEIAERFADVERIPVPARWVGYQVQAEQVEFWQRRRGRSHNRIRVDLDVSGNNAAIRITRLQP